MRLSFRDIALLNISKVNENVWQCFPLDTFSAHDRWYHIDICDLLYFLLVHFCFRLELKDESNEYFLDKIYVHRNCPREAKHFTHLKRRRCWRGAEKTHRRNQQAILDSSKDKSPKYISVESSISRWMFR